ncbi:LEA type 2 family protein [Halorussus halophilus]|uniref:LEA type 2 family protein n=1 Tax=Halorussus halophilus TaxID=2650975 RepID=UPI0013011988|nr:LEA type 2 family protein [Halorussus halophilus]
MSLVGGTLGKIATVLVVGMVVTTVGLGAALSTGTLSTTPPSVESIENEWGEVSADRTEIRTTIAVNNPNKVSIPGVAGVSYEVAMNDVTLANGKSGGVGLSPGRNELTLTTGIDNQQIPSWWASHINNGEETTVSISPKIRAVGISQSVPTQKQTFSTDLLASFNSQSGQPVQVGNRTLLTVESTSASWGHATESETPLNFAGTVRNPNDSPLKFSKIGYTVRMNDVTVAEGTTDEGVEVAARSTETIRINSTLDNGKLDEWWVSHIENDERTRLDVQAFAVVETDEGTQRVPLPFLSKAVVFETDVLGGGQATTRAVSGEAGMGFEPPTVETMESDWGASGEDTKFSTRVVVNNPNGDDSSASEVGLDAAYTVSLNDVTLVEDETNATLGPGRNELTFASDVPRERIQRWWVSHVNNGEQTKLRTDSSVRADLGFATVPVELPEREQTFETDMLAGFETTEQRVEIRGRHVATFGDMQSRWGEATFERTPMLVTGEVQNERSRPLEIVKFGYQVEMNDVVLADNATKVGTTVPGQSTRRIETTGYLDNAKIGDWWVSHLENGERSELSVTYYAVVEYRGQRHRVALDSMSYTDTIETNAFGTSGQ